MRMGLDYNPNAIIREAQRILRTDPVLRDALIARGGDLRGAIVVDPPSMTARLTDEEGREVPISETSSRAIGTIATARADPSTRNASREPFETGIFVQGYAASASQRAAEHAIDRASALNNAAQAARHLERIGRRSHAAALRRQAEEAWP